MHNSIYYFNITQSHTHGNRLLSHFAVERRNYVKNKQNYVNMKRPIINLFNIYIIYINIQKCTKN